MDEEAHSGWCLNERGLDQNEGHKNQANNLNKLECLKYCKEVMNVNVTGCEYHHSGSCIYHSKPLSGGSGNHDFTCWVFRNASRIQ